MSVAFWGSFFRDAGIPSSLAKSYASTFDENRIGKDMLLDLDKEILADMGIKVMGDVIAILKHAKKEARKERPSVPVSSKHTKPSSAVHSTQSAQAPAVSTTSSPLHTDEDYLDEAGLVEYQEGQPDLPAQHQDLQPEQFGTLHSDQLLFQQVVAAVAQQQQQQHMEEEEELAVGGQIDPVLLGLQEDEFQEEYVTAAYKRQQQKRALGVLYSDDPYVEPQPKQPRLIILPQGDGHRQVGGEELEVLGTSAAAAASETSSRRMLEAAGLVKRDGVHISPSEKTAVTSSVFSRLDRKTDTTSPPSAKQHFSAHSPPSPSSSASSPPSALIPSKRTIVNTSPSPKKLSLRVTSRDGRRVSETQGGGAAADAPGTRRAVMLRNSSSGAKKRESNSGRGLVSSSSSFGNKEPIRNRLGTRSGDHGGGGGGSSRRSGVTDWPETVSTSITSTSGSSGRVSSRLGGVHRETSASSRKPRPTMMADSASSPPPKVTSRLGTTHKTSKNTVSSAAFSSGSLGSSSRPPQQRKSKPPASMVADEYELRRQLDIRSRLVQREKMVRERRSGPLRGRLGKHRVFQRLT